MSDGAPGGTNVEFGGDDQGHSGAYHPQVIYTLDVSDGQYSVMATVEVRNFKDEPDVAACAINGLRP